MSSIKRAKSNFDSTACVDAFFCRYVIDNNNGNDILTFRITYSIDIIVYSYIVTIIKIIKT